MAKWSQAEPKQEPTDLRTTPVPGSAGHRETTLEGGWSGGPAHIFLLWLCLSLSSRLGNLQGTLPGGPRGLSSVVFSCPVE